MELNQIESELVERAAYGLRVGIDEQADLDDLRRQGLDDRFGPIGVR